MTSVDAVVVGGGPAGSTCARLLTRAGWNVLVLDRAQFPRDKVCAGWLTPPVFTALELSPEDYRRGGFVLQTITTFHTGLMGHTPVETRYDHAVSYAIRRCEFDHFLLRRSGARVLERTPVEALRRDGSSWVINEQFQTPVVIGAGGHFCPVARHLRGGLEDASAIVAKEAEFPIDADGPPPEPQLYFCPDLDGYAWCVRKGNYLNVGIGRRSHDGFNAHAAAFQSFLEARGVPGAGTAKWRGHAYLASGIGARPIVGAGALLIGDAAGLAYPESGEGIRPAIESGVQAARTLIGAGGRCTAADLEPYATAMRAQHPPVAAPSKLAQAINRAVGRQLMKSSAFTRHIVLDRWFLRRQLAPAGR
jgi:geranylgeranyl reductase family protein